ncbi:MAG: bifunctional pyr operon transcriptional regulator/uracil phosphoribosyltransferase PyrR [Actinomycetota bacterium]
MNPPAAHRETRILDGDDIRRAVTRISHEIVERNQGTGALVVVGVQTGGVWIAEQIAANIASIEPGRDVALGTVDVSMYRDDLALRPVVPAAPTSIPCDLTGATVVLVDNVLYTGRTVRAALEALNDHGRPRAVQLAVIVDRGHRELPIRPDYVGKNVPTHMADDVTVGPAGVVISTTMEVTA